VYHLDLERNNAVSFLAGEPPRKFALLTARNVMASDAVCVGLREPAARVRCLLASTTHNGFPVVDERWGCTSSRIQLTHG
jgi:chloride channel 7